MQKASTPYIKDMSGIGWTLLVTITLTFFMWLYYERLDPERHFIKLHESGIRKTGAVVYSKANGFSNYAKPKTQCEFNVDGRVYLTRKVKLARKYNIGDTLEVIYMPDNPKINAIIEDGMFK